MTRDGLRARWNHFRLRLSHLLNGLPHGCDPQLDIERRLTRTTIDTVFDVGANRGQSAVRLRRWYPHAELHCFEPGRDTFMHLQQTVNGWPRTFTHNLALDAEPGEGSMRAAERDDQAQLARAAPAAAVSRVEVVEIDTLDAVCQRLGTRSIDYLKIDTEGCDLNVLRGGWAMLQRDAVSIVEVEAGMHGGNTLHVPAESLTTFLDAQGFRLFGIYEQTLEWPTADAHLRRANLVFVSPGTIARNRWTPS